MNEATVINLALVVRVFVVGGILLLLPRITRKGLLFGAYIGEEVADRDAARRLLVGWRVGCAILMVLSLLIGLAISLAGWPLPGNFTGTAVLLIGGGVLYLRFHFKAQQLAPPIVAERAAQAVAPLGGDQPTGVGMARLTLAICLLASLVTFAYAMVKQQAADKSFVSIMYAPSFNLVLSPFLAVIALLSATAKRSLRGGSGGGSIEAQRAFRATMTRVYTWGALLFCAFTTFFSVQIVRFEVGEIDNPGLEVLLAAAIVIIFFAACLVRIIRIYGQGGARLERGTAEAPLTDGLADNAHWVWGLFYVDRDDPSTMVESRFGIGYTFNYGNRTTILILAAFLALSLALVALAVFKTLAAGG
jgi:hypothetical protein